LLSDSEDVRGDLSILKQLVGADALRGRRKYHQGAFEVVPEALVMMISNQPIRARDTSNALARRIRAMYANNPVPKGDRETLLAHDGDSWKGALASELPGIVQWVYAQAEDDDSIKEKMLANVPSLHDVERENEENLNPMLAWVREELTVGPGSYVGYKPEVGAKGLVEGERRRALYP